MIRIFRRSWLLLGLVLFAACSMQVQSAPAWPTVAPEDSDTIMGASELKRGMKGYGLTVFQGTRIEKFEVEILGVLKQMNFGRDLILVRLAGGPITQRQTGIISGMSGSPCYIDGKLIGAVAYGAIFPREPIGLITPIEDMLEAWDENLPDRASGYSSPQPLAQSVTVAGKTVHSVSIVPTYAEAGREDDGVLYMQPLMTPLMATGLSQKGISALSAILRPYHIQPMAGPGGAAEAGKAELVPGAAVGVSLAWGDIDLTGIGTLTYRRGNRIIGFGHPMLGIGAVDAPMTTAYVNDVMPSLMSSFKFASPLEMVGRIFQDRQWSVAGEIGSMPSLIPVTVSIDDRSQGRARTYNVNVINHPLLASRIIALVVDEAIYQVHSTPGDATAEVTYEIEADQIGKITRSNVFFDPTGVDMAVTSDIAELLQLLSSNKFHPLDVKSVKMDVRIIDKRDTASIDRIFVKQSEYEPGETIEVGVVLRPYKKDRITKTFSIKLPATANDGKMVLQVRGGATPSIGVPDVGGMGDEDGPMPSGGGSALAAADNIQQLVEKYLERERNDQVVLQLLMRSTAINVAGEKLTGLPDPIALVMKSSRNSGVRVQRDEVKEIFDSEMIVYGAARLAIEVKGKDLTEKEEPKKKTSSSGSSSSSYSTMSAGPLRIGDSSELIDLMFEPTASEPGASEPGVFEPDVAVTEDVVETESDPTDEGEADADSEETTSRAKTASKTESASDVTTVVRALNKWTQTTQKDFAKGTFDGVSASTRDSLQLAPTLEKLVETPEQFIWCVEIADDGVFAGSGNSGTVYHVTDAGEMSVLFETGELEVHSLVRDSKGVLYAGTSPDGKIFKISADGKGELLCDLDENYVLALAVDDKDDLYAGVGDAGKVYRITDGGELELFSAINEQQILSLHWSADGKLLVGTGIKGVVYEIDQSGEAQPIFDAEEGSATAIAGDSQGNIYAGTSPEGAIYKIMPDGRSKTVFEKAEQVLSMVCDDNDNVYAMSDSTLIRIAPDETITNLDSGKNKLQLLDLAFNNETSTLYAGAGNIGAIYMSRCCELGGNYESPVHDAKMVSNWSRIKWSAVSSEGSTVELRTRVGNVDKPDETWSRWSAPYTDPAGEEIAGPDARYIQYCVTMSTGRSKASPEVSSVTLSYMTPNQPPVVKLSSPTGGEVLSGDETIKWAAVDPDKDTITYDVYYSSDGGENWTSLLGGQETEDGEPEKVLTEEEIVEKVKSELEASSDVPEEMKEAVLEENEAPGAPPSSRTAAAGKSSKKTLYNWDTTEVDDGTYLVKVIANDRTSNAVDWLTDEVISEPFVICNTGPKLTLYKTKLEIEEAAEAQFGGSALSETVEIVGVQYKVDDGDWTAAVPYDGLFDSPYEVFDIKTDVLKEGDHTIEVQAVDAAGNASTGKVEVTVGASEE